MTVRLMHSIWLPWSRPFQICMCMSLATIKAFLLVLIFSFQLKRRKYERTKQIALDLKEREEQIGSDRKTLTDNLKMQEARYEKMKTHAMSQLEM